MSLFALIRFEWRLALGRPLLWIFLLLTLLFNVFWYLAKVQFAGGIVTGGLGEDEKIHRNGPYLLTLFHLLVPFAVYTLFMAFAMGSAAVRDAKLGIEPVLRSTRLSAATYTLGKFLGTASWLMAIVLIGAVVGYAADCLTASAAAEGGMADSRLYGTPNVLYHLVPLGGFTLPWLAFVMAVPFYLGVRTGSASAAFFPMLLFFGVANFVPSLDTQALQTWSENTLGVPWKQVLGWIDPTGFGFLTAEYATEDRGVAFYNSVIPRPDLGFIINRAVFVILAIASFAASIARATRRADGPLAAAQEIPPIPHRSAEAVSTSTSVLGVRDWLSGRARGRGGFMAVLRSELRLLSRQPSAWIFLCWILLVGVSGAVAVRPGAWDSEVYATSMSASVLLVRGISLWICGLTASLVVEGLMRERQTGFSQVFHTVPVRDGAIFWGKLVAVFLVSSCIVAITGAVTAACQAAFHPGFPVEVATYAQVLGVFLVPALVFTVALSALATTVARTRLTAYALLLAFALPYLLSIVAGWVDWRGLVVPTAFISMSDITGLGPYRTELALNRGVIVGAAVALAVLARALFRRNDRPLWRPLSLASLGRHRLMVLSWTVVVLGASSCAWWLSVRSDQGPGAEWRDDWSDRYAQRNRRKWGDPHRIVPEFEHLDFEITFHPAEREFELDGRFTFVNRGEETHPVIPLTIGPDWDIELADVDQWVDGQRHDVETVDRNGLYEVRVAPPMAPGDRVTLAMRYEGRVEPGTRSSGAFSQWVFPEAIFVHSFGPTILPVPGYVEPETMVEDVLDDALTPQQMARALEGVRRAQFGGLGAFTVDVRVVVPDGLEALSSGIRVGEETRGDQRLFHYRTDAPVYFFPIMAGVWERREQGDCTVLYHAAHERNVDDIAMALDQARRYFSAIHAPYPYRELRIVEFPAVAGFAMGHPTLIPFSESIGFLTKGDDGVSNVNFMVTAHEVAHQWWGTVVTPARAPGAAFLTEALAHYSTLLMEERFQGRVSARNRRRQFERLYVEGRVVDVERPIVRIDGSEPGDTITWYNKGGWAFWMLSEWMGRERFLAALRTFIDEYSFQDDHPTIHDLLRHVRMAGEDLEDLEAELSQWFYEVVLPKPRVKETFVTGDGASGYVTRIVVENEGTGRFDLTVEVADRRRRTMELGLDPAPQRLTSDDLSDALGWESELAHVFDDEKPYRAARGRVTLGKGTTAEVTIETDFRPEVVLLDPDVQLLMSGRNLARSKIAWDDAGAE